MSSRHRLPKGRPDNGKEAPESTDAAEAPEAPDAAVTETADAEKAKAETADAETTEAEAAEAETTEAETADAETADTESAEYPEDSNGIRRGSQVRQAEDRLAARSRLRRAAGPRTAARIGSGLRPMGVRRKRLRCTATRCLGAEPFSGNGFDCRSQGQHHQDVVVQAGHRRAAAQLRSRPADR